MEKRKDSRVRPSWLPERFLGLVCEKKRGTTELAIYYLDSGGTKYKMEHRYGVLSHGLLDIESNV